MESSRLFSIKACNCWHRSWLSACKPSTCLCCVSGCFTAENCPLYPNSIHQCHQSWFHLEFVDRQFLLFWAVFQTVDAAINNLRHTWPCGRGLQTVNWQRNKSLKLLQDLMFQGWCWFKILGQLTLTSSHKFEDFASFSRMLSSSENASDCFSNLLHRPARFWSSAWCRRPAWVLGHFFFKRGTDRLVSYVSCSFYIDPNRPFHLPWKSFWTVSETHSQHDVRANRHQKNPWNWLLSTVSYFLRLKFLLTMKLCEMVWRCLKWSWKTFAKALINVGCM